ncbi:MAG: hypothetical protein DSZ00_11090 [Gammaproteobacteria bacterium]|nr:MAG: hypothetical protein DSZ00_11090 [Gammaproteobacteria bacterium]
MHLGKITRDPDPSNGQAMRGPDIQQDMLFSKAGPEQRIPKGHPLHPIRQMVDKALRALDGEMGHDSNPPQKLLRAQVQSIPAPKH